MEPSPILASEVLSRDCQECRITGAASCAFIGSFVLYQSSGGFYAKRPYTQLAVRSIAAVAYYTGVARWFYLPPFTYLKGSNDSITVKSE